MKLMNGSNNKLLKISQGFVFCVNGTTHKIFYFFYTLLAKIFCFLDDGPCCPFCLFFRTLAMILSRFFRLILSGSGSVEIVFRVGTFRAIFLASLLEVFFICNMYSGTSHPEFRITVAILQSKRVRTIDTLEYLSTK